MPNPSWYEKKRAAGEIVTTLLRMPPDLHAELKAQAAREGRSLHAQLLHLVTKSLHNEERRLMRENPIRKLEDYDPTA